MSIDLFDMLFCLIEPFITKHGPRTPLPAQLRLFVTIKFLATGNDIRSIAESYRIGYSTTLGIIKETCTVLWKVLKPLYLIQSKKDDWKRLATEFDQRWNFPNCIGAMDGKHIRIKAPKNSGSIYFNCKKYFSIVLFAIPSPFPLPGTTIPFPYFFIGDAAFPLKLNLLRPFSGSQLPPSEATFNKRMSSTRQCIEDTFGILASRWRIFHKEIELSPENATTIVAAATILHNFIRKEGNPEIQNRYNL